MILYLLVLTIAVGLGVFAFSRNYKRVRCTILVKNRLQRIANEHAQSQNVDFKQNDGTYAFILDEKSKKITTLTHDERSRMVGEHLATDEDTLKKCLQRSRSGGGFVRMPWYLNIQGEMQNIICYAVKQGSDILMVCGKM